MYIREFIYDLVGLPSRRRGGGRVVPGIGVGGVGSGAAVSGSLGLTIQANRPWIQAVFVIYLPEYMVKTSRNCYKILLFFRELRARI